MKRVRVDVVLSLGTLMWALSICGCTDPFAEQNFLQPPVHPDVAAATPVADDVWVGELAGDLKIIQFDNRDADPGDTAAPNDFEKAEKESEDAKVVHHALRFRWCPAGSFVMGSPQDEPDRHPDEDQVVAVISTGFWTAETEVTLSLWRSVMGHAKDRFITSEPDHPMHDVNWDEAHTFCRTLTTTLHETDVLSPKWELSLPTEAQWEYACRAGSRTITAFGDSLSGAQAQIDGAFPIGDAAIVPRSGLTAQVGSFPPNAWGLRDMHGNVWEWCADWYTDQLPGGIDPCIKNVSKATLSISSQKPIRVLRGGGFIRGAGAWRSADRGYSKPTAQGAAVGFRVVCRKRAK